MKYVMFEHAGSGNHGCEAIVRSTIDILGKNEYYLQSYNLEEDKRYGLGNLVKLIESKSDNVNRNSFLGIQMRLRQRLISKYDYDTYESVYRHSALLQKGSVALSIGGDNYCYNGIIGSIRDKLKAFNVKGIPCILWGCSIDENYLSEIVVSDLKQYSLITARESITLETLHKIGLKDKVINCSDPAFILHRQAVDWKSHIFQRYDVIGVNISDFMVYYDSYPNATYNNFRVLIDYLLKTTDCYIAIIPHVRQKGNNDLIPSKQIVEEFNNERIILVKEDYNCMQLKYIISRCRLFIGCRTHSTIAAYSSSVPTLVVGYSVKAKGIAKDIFGTYKGLIVDVREFESDTDLLRSYLEFCYREIELRNRLNKVMPEYVARAYISEGIIKEKTKSLC